MRRLNLAARMGLLVLAGVLPLLAFGLGSVWAGYRNDRAQATRQALERARGLALAVEDEIRARVAVLEVLALSRSLAVGDVAGFRTEAEAVVDRQFPGASLLLLRPDGQQVMNTALPAEAPLPVRRYRANLDRVVATGRPSVSDVYHGLVLGRPVVAIEVPVRDAAGRLAFVLALNPGTTAFAALIARHRGAEDAIVTILDRTGVRIARMPGAERHVGQPVTSDFLAAWRTGAAEATLETIAPEGIRVLTAFVRLPEHGWGVAVAVSAEVLRAAALRSALTLLAVGVALLLLGLALARAVARGVTGPMRTLRQLAAAAPENGSGLALRGAPPETGLPEADEVAAALVAEARRRGAATASLLDSERRLRLVVAELNHRAKNALATVQSLALQTARGEAGGDPARFAAEFGARLRSLARAHDLLAAFSWEGAALGAVVRTGLAPWLEAPEDAATPMEPPRVAIECNGPAAPLPQASPGQAQALVMALHELATNAVKHGALSTPAGRVAVSCHAEPGDEAGVLAARIEWRETGGPRLAGPPARRGFGTRLLERALVHDLGAGAGVRLDFAPEGLVASIRFVPRADAAGWAELRHAAAGAMPDPSAQDDRAHGLPAPTRDAERSLSRPRS